MDITKIDYFYTMNLVQLDPDIWTASQSLSFFGLEVGNRMTVIRLKSGALVIISPIKLKEDEYLELNKIGEVSHIIVPNLLFHDLYVTHFQKVYPKAKLWGVKGLAEKRPDLNINGLLDKPGALEESLEYLPFEGLKTALPIWKVLEINETVFFHRSSKTLVLTDIAFNFDENNELQTQIVARFLGCYKRLRPSWVEKLVTQNKSAVRQSVSQVLKWDFHRVVPAHGSTIEMGGKAKFKTAFIWFLGNGSDS